MTIEIRPITSEDWQEYCNRRAEAYHIDYSNIINKPHTVNFEETRCLFVDGVMSSTGRLYPFEQSLHGRWLPMGGIASIATRLEDRGKGYIRMILAHMLEEMRDRNIPISCLYPTVPPFYRQFGWEFVSEKRIFKSPIQSGLFQKALHRTKGTVRRALPSDLPLINRIYETYAADRPGYLRRSEQHWQERVFRNPFTDKERLTFLWSDDDREAQAYLVLNPSENFKVLIKELISLTPDGMINLLSMLQKDNILKEWEWETDVESPLPLLLNTRMESSVSATFMARIVKIEEAWKYHASDATPVTLRLAVQDSFCPWNEGVWELRIEGDSTTVEQTDDAPQASADINTWTQLYYNSLSLDQALFLGKLNLHDTSILPNLRTLWSTPHKPMMVDFF
jgi:predicted acetyltransferase